MVGVLAVLWGRSLRRDLGWMASRTWGRLSLAAASMAIVFAAGALAVRVARAMPDDSEAFSATAVPVRVNRELPSAQLVDQHGDSMTFADYRSTPALLTFAFGHCTTMCPATVSQLKLARSAARLSDLPILVITLDPWRDTPERLAGMVERWELGAGDRVLSGDIGEVERVLDELDIARRRNETTGDVDHVSTVMVLDGAGKIAWRVEASPASAVALLKNGRTY